jgi:hypothetical protein
MQTGCNWWGKVLEQVRGDGVQSINKRLAFTRHVDRFPNEEERQVQRHPDPNFCFYCVPLLCSLGYEEVLLLLILIFQ